MQALFDYLWTLFLRLQFSDPKYNDRPISCLFILLKTYDSWNIDIVILMIKS